MSPGAGRVRLGLLALVAGSACVSVRHTYVDQPPFIGGRMAPDGPGHIHHLPIAWQGGRDVPVTPALEARGAEPGSAVARLLRAMNAFLDSLDLTVPLAVESMPAGGPDVYFGCRARFPPECDERGDSAGTGQTLHELAVRAARSSWTHWLQETIGGGPTRGVVLITLETAYHLPREGRGYADSPVLVLGTDHAVPVSWLTSSDTPVAVLQLTGVLLDASGRAVRYGAEGLLPRFPGLAARLFEADPLISEEDVELARTRRREDLPGAPLVWEAALYALVTGLTGAPETLH